MKKIFCRIKKLLIFASRLGKTDSSFSGFSFRFLRFQKEDMDGKKLYLKKILPVEINALIFALR
ncbi:MAG: hypothetical protein JNL72_03510 [Flavipsychrobacter sp.]|nr:hypothetical protein [Flavipsychrobacter sp.]